MKKKLQKIFSLMLVFSMLASMMSVSAGATEANNSEADPIEAQGEITEVGADSGIDFRLFNYAGDPDTDGIIDQGVNANTFTENGKTYKVRDFFKFRGIFEDNSSESYFADLMNPIWDDDGFTEDRVQLLPTLDGNGNPVVDTSRALALVNALNADDRIVAAGGKITTAEAGVATATANVETATANVETAQANFDAAAEEEKEQCTAGFDRCTAGFGRCTAGFGRCRAGASRR